MAENYKHLYEQIKKMLTMYQDELIPGFRKQIEELETKNKWIPVSERLPEDNKKVLVLIASKIEVIAILRNNVWLVSWNHVTLNHVTHWMPLPEPPKEEDNA